jgi:hypothetical protein
MVFALCEGPERRPDPTRSSERLPDTLRVRPLSGYRDAPGPSSSMEEQRTFNPLVQGSSPWGGTTLDHDVLVRCGAAEVPPNVAGDQPVDRPRRRLHAARDCTSGAVDMSRLRGPWTDRRPRVRRRPRSDPFDRYASGVGGEGFDGGLVSREDGAVGRGDAVRRNATRPRPAAPRPGDYCEVSSASRACTLRLISSRMGRIASTPWPAGSSSGQSR